MPNKKTLLLGLEYEKVCTYIQSFADDENGRLFGVPLVVLFISHDMTKLNFSTPHDITLKKKKLATKNTLTYIYGEFLCMTGKFRSGSPHCSYSPRFTVLLSENFMHKI